MKVYSRPEEIPFDAYSSRDVQFLPVKKVLRHIDQGKRLAAHFG